MTEIEHTVLPKSERMAGGFESTAKIEIEASWEEFENGKVPFKAAWNRFEAGRNLENVSKFELSVAPPPEDGSETEDYTFDPSKLGLSFKKIYYPEQPEEWDYYQ